MKLYNVYFEIFGKKMKASIEAKTREEAYQKVKDKIIFHKITELVEKEDQEGNDIISQEMREVFESIFKFKL